MSEWHSGAHCSSTEMCRLRMLKPGCCTCNMSAMVSEPLVCQLHEEDAIIFRRSLSKFQVGVVPLEWREAIP